MSIINSQINVYLSSLERFAIRFGGAAGDGLQSTGRLLQKYFNRLNYYVQGYPGTQSTIRGGHVWQHVEFSSYQIYSHTRELDLLVSFHNVTIDVHLRDLKRNGYLIYDSDKVDIKKHIDIIKNKQISVIDIPLSSIARSINMKSPILKNTIVIGFILKLLNLDTTPYFEMIRERFVNNETIIKDNENAFITGSKLFDSSPINQLILVDPSLFSEQKIIVNGNESIALGAVASGLKFLAQYPITPASSILTYLSKYAELYNISVKQSEDELSAIMMTIGASFAGARSMTASSGPGLSLMAEAFGYAAMTETPIVVVNSMRGGPSTGIPTKMEQTDLLSMIHLSHGESPRAVFAPRNITEAFEVTVRAFNIADRYQIPVIILSDFALSERTENVNEFNMKPIIDRGKIWTKPTEEFPVFKRYALTDDGISPRVFPPTKNGMYILVGAEHDEFSHSLSGNKCGLPESWAIHENMIEKRFKKLELLRDELLGPELYGPKIADHTILCWGSTQGAVIEAVKILNKESSKTWNGLSFVDLHPLPFNKIKPYLEKIKHSILIEVNYTGQFEKLLHEHLDWRPDEAIHPLSGETPTHDSIIQDINNILLRRN